MQFHGTADIYSLAGAARVATLFTNATTPAAGNAPAVTLRSVGANGGQAAAFTYDLARSIVYTRQGNPDWEGQERDGLSPIRSDDLYFGDAAGDPQPDWVDLDKVAIPQADEQQRLLANLILQMNTDQKPLPRFWYFPNDYKAVVVMTGDDHGATRTQDHFDAFAALSPSNCSVDDWECIRGTSYIYTGVPLSNAQAAAYDAAGFEIALHVNTGCLNYTQSSLDSDISTQLAEFQAVFGSLPSPTTNRTHCIAWSDWASQAVVENSYGIRLDTNYYYYPSTWINGRDGFFTGSGMPMRFASLTGTIIDVYQATTQMTDESQQSYPATANTLLDRAIGPEGYYGAFTANMHTDRDPADAVAIVGSAQARGVPVVTARQMLEWLDGRNSSSFGSLSLTGDTLTFSISVGQGANNLRAMLPLQTDAGPITSINYNGAPLSFTTEVIKGVEYAIFPAAAGVYQASTTPLPPDTEAPSVAITSPTEGAIVAGTVTITADASDNVVVAGVQFQLNGANLGPEDTVAPYSTSWDTTTVTNGVYQLTAVARDAANNTSTSDAVNVTVDNVPDTTPPTVTAVLPAAGAVDVSLGDSVMATFDEAMDPATINGTTFELRDAADNPVPASVSYDAATKTAALNPTSILETSATYTATVKGGGTDPRVKDLAGNALANDYTWSFTTALQSPYSSIWDDSVTPAITSENDPNAIEVGVKFQSDVDGYISGIRFYKGPSNTGTHIGNLWDNAGQLLATATFVTETATGWQQVFFSNPVSITANTTYVASYHTQPGFYALDSNYFAVSGVDNPPLRALADGVSGGNGVYTYSATSAFPTTTFSASNYWVDVLFTTTPVFDTTPPTVAVTAPVSGTVATGTIPVTAAASDDVGVVGVQFLLDGANLGIEDTVPPYSLSWDTTAVTDGGHQLAAVARDWAGNTTTSTLVTVTVDNSIDITPPTVTGTTPAAGATDVALAASVTATFNEAMDPATMGTNTFELRDPSNNLVAATVSYDGASQTATLSPNLPLAYSTPYTATVKGGATDPRVKDVAGNALAADYTWSFSTVAPPQANCPCSIWGTTITPTVTSANDPNAIELGVKFQSEIDGYVSSIRFYKGITNTGTHIGNLWSSDGTLLATGTFVNETASGWQQVNFATPVAVTANTTYVASYHTDVGFYAADSAYFAASGVDNPPLRALANGVEGGNGLYVYSASSAFPTDSYNATNYWVDVVFTTSLAPDTTPPTVTVTSPISGTVATGTIAIEAAASDDIAVAGVQFQLNGTNLGAEDTLAPYAINWDSTTVANGAYQLTAVARDGAGNTATSSPVNVTVDNFVDTTPPTVTGMAPADGATDVAVDAVLTASFSEAMDPATVDGTTFELRDPGNNLVAATVSYDGPSQTATLTPTADLAYSTSYTAIVKGGAVDPRVKDVAGNALATDYTWSFTTVAAPCSSSSCTIWDATATPAVESVNDLNAIELGVKFQSDIDGYVTSIRFYKGITNTGAHIGNLWSSDGTLLATGTFVNETASGWQQVNFATPVAVISNTTYVASYHTDVGYYAADSNYFATSGVNNPPLRALANGVDGGNGLYLYTATSAFPTVTFNAANYWVDVVFTTNLVPDTTAPTVSITAPANGATISGTLAITADAADNVAVAGVQFLLGGANLGAEDTAPPYSLSWDTTTVADGAYQLTAVARDGAGNTTTSTPPVNVTVDNIIEDTTPPTVTGTTPAAAATGVAVDAVLTASFSEAMDPATIDGTTFELRDGANNLVPAVVSYDGPSQTATLTPSAPLANAVQYVATIRGGAADPRVKDVAGNALAGDFTWSFTTVSAVGANCPCSIWDWSDSSVVPQRASVNDPNPIELGVKFQSEIDGYITGIGFYKGPSNAGTHIGNLWSSGGTLLATGTFVNETASGWQQVSFAAPVQITANTTYIASYHAEVGDYAVSQNYFRSTGVDNSPLRALADGADGGNGVYTYGPSGFPTSSYKSTNYWVDVVFVASP